MFWGAKTSPLTGTLLQWALEIGFWSTTLQELAPCALIAKRPCSRLSSQQKECPSQESGAIAAKRNACFLCGKAMQRKRPPWFFFVFDHARWDESVKRPASKTPAKVYYDHMKDGVDAVDLMSAMASKREKNKCWTMNALFYMLDTVPTNCRTL